MAGYLLKRLLQSAVLFWIVTIVTFVIIRQAPGGPAILANPDLSKAQMETLTVSLGLADPIYVQYGRWISGVFKGNLGTSFNEGVPVFSLIAERLPNTLLLSSVSLVIAVTVGMALGILSAVRRDSLFDGLA